MTYPLAALASRTLVAERLKALFPASLPEHLYCTRDTAVATVYCMLYIGAIEGTGCLAAPKHIYRMSDTQAKRRTDAARLDYGREAMVPGYVPKGKAWYADTSREPIRDETLKQGLVPVGAVLVDLGVPTTSSKPRYSLAKDFAALFDPELGKKVFAERVVAWRNQHLSSGARARVTLMNERAAADASDVIVTLPNGDSRRLDPGPSSVITKAVIEQFAAIFLGRPAVVWVSTSGKKVTVQDDVLARRLGLRIDAATLLPDVILVDLEPPTALIIFVEVVATDGAITESRRQSLTELAAGYGEADLAFVTAFMDRSEPVVRKTLPSLAWGSFAWFASEPEGVVGLLAGRTSSRVRLHQLVRARA